MLKQAAIATALFLCSSAEGVIISFSPSNKQEECVKLDIGKAGNAVCYQLPTPTPIPPTPCPSPPGRVVMQTLYMSGTNNYAVDDVAFVNPPPGSPYAHNPLALVTAQAPAGSVQVFTLPKTWTDGSAATNGAIGFVDWLLNGQGVQYEVALSQCVGDFTYYKSPQAAVGGYYPCGIVSGPFININWTPQGQVNACKVDQSKTWYVNWRLVPGTTAGCNSINVGGTIYHTCGGAFSTTKL